jgi:WD40 repeat protein
MTSKIGADIRLKPIQPKATWGCRTLADKLSVVGIADFEYVVAVGTGLMIFDNNAHGIRKTFLVDSHNTDVAYITQIVRSFDGKFLATVVKMKNEDEHSVYILLYTVEHLRSEHRSPRLITYRNPSFIAGGEKIELNCLAFSHDSQFIAIGTNIPAVGVVIIDQRKGDVFQTIPTNSIPSHITFNPLDPLKICVTGTNGLFQFWRFTVKSIHLAPVVGLRGHSVNYTHHTWITPYTDALVIAATSTGLLAVVMGGEQKGANVHAFGAPAAASSPHHHHHQHGNKQKDAHRANEHSIVQIMVRGDVILVVSPYNEIVAFEVRRVIQSKGINNLFPTLGLLKRYRLSNIDEVVGMEWCIRDSVTSFAVVGMTRQSVFHVEVIGDIDTEVTAGINSAGDAAQDAADLLASAEWVSIANEQPIFRFHGDEVHSMATASRTNTMVTSSHTDGTVRVWNYTTPSSYRASWVVESFVDRPQENPLHVDIHPSGLLVLMAIDGEVREFAITDEHLDLYRRVSVKGPFTGPTGTAHVISQPVSFVKYSNGGQYFIVVTGKLAQVFNTNVLEYGQSGGNDNIHNMKHVELVYNFLLISVYFCRLLFSLTGPGLPARVMVLCDHIAPITDAEFSRDDSRIITASSDGCLYHWKVGAFNRDQEFVCKGVSITKVALSKTKGKETHIIAVCESHNEYSTGPAASQGQGGGEGPGVLMRRQSTVSMTSRKMQGRLAVAQEGGSFSDAPQGLSRLGSMGPTENFFASGGESPSKPYQQQQWSKKTFLAIWKDNLGPNPRILDVDAEIKCIALGETDGPDKIEICVLGTADGRVLVSLLPLPSFSRVVDVSGGISVGIAAQAQSHPNATSGGNGGAPARRHKGMIAGSMDASGPDKSKKHQHQQVAGGRGGNSSDAVSVQTGGSDASGTDTEAASLAQRDDMSMFSRHNAGDGSDSVTGTAAGAVSGGGGGCSVVVSGGSSKMIGEAQQERLDESRCKQFRMHSGAVSLVTITRNGMWIFSAGTDGVIHMYATSKRALDMTEMPASQDSFENKFHIMESSKLKALRAHLIDTERLIESNKKDYDLKVEKILESKEKLVKELQSKMQKEIKQRDETILNSRNEYLKLKTSMNSEIAGIRKQCNDSISELELTYEQKLSQESLYLDKMKQAYDEYVVHSRMDLNELQKKTNQRVENVEQEKINALLEAERQKKTVLQYFDYVKLRGDELMQSLEQSQVEERLSNVILYTVLYLYL